MREMMARDLEEELDAAQEDVLFSRARLKIAEAGLAVDVKRLEEVQAAIAVREELKAEGVVREEDE